MADNEWPIEWDHDVTNDKPQKISDLLPSEGELANCELTVSVDGVSYTLENLESFTNENSYGRIFSIDNDAIYVNLMLSVISTVSDSADETGLYVMLTSIDTSSDASSLHFALTKGVLQLSFDLQSWLTGFVIGLAGKPLPHLPPKKQPVAYLYNGVSLPPLPEWDIETYPYATMVTSTDSQIESAGIVQFALLFLTTAPLYTAKPSIYRDLVATDDCSGICFMINTEYGVTDEDWKLSTKYGGNYTSGNTVYTITLATLRWVNYKILDENGELYRDITDPVPVYE